MSDNHIDPDLAVEVFVLEPLPPAAHSSPADRGDAGASCPGGRTGEPGEARSDGRAHESGKDNVPDLTGAAPAAKQAS